MRFLLILALVLSQGPSSTPVGKPVSASSTTSAKTEPTKTKQPEVSAVQAGDDRLAKYTLLLAICTGALVFVAWYQGKQLKATVEQMRASEERQLRAYVLIETVQPLISAPPSLQTVPYGIAIKNSGQTPAYDVTVQGTIALGPAEEATPPSYPSEGRESKGTIAPGGFISQTFKVSTFSPEQLAMLQEGTHRVYLYGTIGYRDAFSKRRYANFRYIRERNSNEFEACNEGNDSD